MIYTIAAIPTTYKGILFRSRLEATWAAFFDLCGWEWKYEPCDFNKWLPDFRITTSVCNVYAEVKPIDLDQVWRDIQTGKPLPMSYGKATNNSGEVPVILLGNAPMSRDGIGLVVMERGRAHIIAGSTLEEIDRSLHTKNAATKWREADNIVMGIPPSNRKHSIFSGVWD